MAEDVVVRFENDKKIDEYVYDMRGDLRLVPPGHVYEETASGAVSIRPVGVSKRFFDVSGGAGGEAQEPEMVPDEAALQEENKEEEPEGSEREIGFETRATMNFGEEDEGEKRGFFQERIYQRSVRELMPLIKAAETLDGLEALREENEDRKTVIRALLKRRRELLAASKG